MWNDLLQTHGYWLLAVGCLLEGETLLVLAGFAAHRGLLDPVAVVGIAATAGFAGDQVFFWLGRRHGAALLARWPSLAQQAARVDRLIERWHEALIVGVRFAYGLRIAGPVLIGASSVSAWRFSAFNAIGALLWATSVAAVGWAFGAAAQALLGELRHVEGWLFAGLLVALGVVWLVRRRRTAKEGRSSRRVQ
ncbi:MAG: DedA family protein [Aquincola sp.]|nr:DedA family protein [Aquincola sp.]MDH4289235.1 DedA family protein [Aquincola sp.]